MKNIKSLFSFMKGNILVITVTRIFGMFSRGAALPYFSLYVLALGGDAASIGFISSLRPLAGLLIFPLAGYVADRTGRVKLIVIAGYLSALTYLLYVFASNWMMLAVGSFILGLIVFQFPAFSALMADSLSPDQRGIGFAMSMAIPGAVAVMAPYFAGYLIDRMGVEMAVRYLYATIVVAYSVSAMIQMKFLKETVERSDSDLDLRSLKEHVSESYRSVITVFKWIPTNLRALALMIALCLVANVIAGPFWIVYATQIIGLSAAEWGMLMSAYSAFRIAFSIPAGAAIDRFGKRKTIIAAFILSIIPLLYFTHSRGFSDILAVFLMLSMANAFLLPAVSAFMADVVPREMRGRVMAAFGRGTIMISPGQGDMGGPGMGYAFALPVTFGSLIGGYIYAVNPTYVWLIQSGLTLTSLVLSVAFLYEPKKAEV